MCLPPQLSLVYCGPGICFWQLLLPFPFPCCFLSFPWLKGTGSIFPSEVPRPGVFCEFPPSEPESYGKRRLRLAVFLKRENLRERGKRASRLFCIYALASEQTRAESFQACQLIDGLFSE